MMLYKMLHDNDNNNYDNYDDNGDNKYNDNEYDEYTTSTPHHTTIRHPPLSTPFY